jgi:putative transposase
VKFRYEGHSVAEAAKMVGVTKMVGYLWQERWNKSGYEGLIPKFAGGRPSKFSNQDFNLLIQILKKRDDWTTEDVQVLIKDKFDITFSLKHIRTILRKIGMKYSKPYQHDYRKPKDAEDILKKT